jgi:hypothetical protein
VTNEEKKGKTKKFYKKRSVPLSIQEVYKKDAKKGKTKKSKKPQTSQQKPAHNP